MNLSLNILFLLISSPLLAQTDLFLGYQRNVLPGGRAATLGGAFTSLSEDPSGAYYNPAGIAFTENNELSTSGTNLYRSRIQYKETIKNQDFSEVARGLFANYIGSNLRLLPPFVFNYSFMTLDAKNIDQNNRFTDISTVKTEARDYSRTHLENNRHLAAGGAVAWQINENFSTGMSAFYYRREIQYMNHQLIEYNNKGVVVLNKKFNTLNDGLMILLGGQFRSSIVQLGLAVKFYQDFTEETTLFDDEVQALPNSENTPSSPKVKSLERKINNFAETNPSTVKMGISTYLTEELLVSFDYMFHFIHNQELPQYDNFAKRTDNYSLGIEWKTWKLALRAGLFTNNSMFKPLSTNQVNQISHINFFGQSLGIGLIGDKGEITVGYVRQNAEGQGQMISDTVDIQEVEGQTEVFIWNASFYLL